MDYVSVKKIKQKIQFNVCYFAAGSQSYGHLRSLDITNV